MTFIDIEDLNISVELDILKRDTQRYSSLFYQHKGDFFANELRIGNANQDSVHTKFIKVIEKAVRDNSALVISPEYSCPRSVIEQIVNNELLKPPLHKIWVLGGESINKEELKLLFEFNTDNVLVYAEDDFANSDKTFLDPLYYIFKGIHKDVPKLIVLIQFKTKHMGVWSGGAIEADNLIEGKNIYIFKNSNSSTRLISFICSEAMNVRQNLTQEVKNSLDWDDKPFLILNPQINPNPSHPEFIDFRRFILECDKKELFSLNWGKETKYEGHNWYPIAVSTARSGIFFKTSEQELDYTNVRIVNNHYKGFYFLHITKDKYVYFFDGLPELFTVENKPVHIMSGTPPQRRREGPEVTNIYSFDNNTSDFTELHAINDRYLDFFNQRGITNSFLLNPANSIIDKERLINLSTGKIIGKLDNRWCEVIYLNSFNLKEADECNCRMTYVEDTYAVSETTRNLNCTNLIELDQIILPNKSQYPESIKDLRHQNIFLSYSQDASTYKHKYNLTNEHGEIKKATVCYIGNVSSSQVKSTYDELQKLFEEGTEGKRRIVVFYKNGVNLRSKFDETAGSVITPSSENGSIL